MLGPCLQAWCPGSKTEEKTKHSFKGTVTGDCVQCLSYKDWNLGTPGYKMVLWDVDRFGCSGPDCGSAEVHSSQIQLEKCVKIGKELPLPKDFSNGLYDE